MNGLLVKTDISFSTDSVLGGECAETMYSLIGSAKLNEINPEVYLRAPCVVGDCRLSGQSGG